MLLGFLWQGARSGLSVILYESLVRPIQEYSSVTWRSHYITLQRSKVSREDSLG